MILYTPAFYRTSNVDPMITWYRFNALQHTWITLLYMYYDTAKWLYMSKCITLQWLYYITFSVYGRNTNNATTSFSGIKLTQTTTVFFLMTWGGGGINPTLLRAALYQNTVTRRPINLLHKAVLFSWEHNTITKSTHQLSTYTQTRKPYRTCTGYIILHKTLTWQIRNQYST